MGEAGRLEEPREVPDVARQPLELHLLLQIQRGVGPQDLVGGIGRRDEGQEPPAQGAGELEPRNLRGHEGVEVPKHRPAAEEVHPFLTQLAGAGPGEHEAVPLGRFDQFVDDAEEFGNPLDLVDDHRGPRRSGEDELPEALGTRAQLAIQLGA